MKLFKKILNTPIADLTHYDAAALQKYKMINAATVILPENPTSEFMQAYSCINVNCATTIKINPSVKIQNANGIIIFNDNNTDDNTIYFSNGITVIDTKEKTPQIISNGIAIANLNSCYKPVFSNGIDTKCDFEFTAVKSFGSDLVIDNDFLEGIENNTLIAASGNLTFNKNTDKELLKERMVFFVSTGNIIAPEKIMSLLKLKSQTTGKFKTNG